jgi:AcrR family transcriptional regulator
MSRTDAPGSPPSRGRRPGSADTRAQILLAASESFGERGYDRTSVRAVAAAAGVDAALVHHYFGSKDALFLAAIGAPTDPGPIIDTLLAGKVSDLGIGIARALLSVWDSPMGTGALALLRSAVTNDVIARMLREFLVDRMVSRVVRDIAPAAEVPWRSALVASEMTGLALTRYVLHVEPLHSAPAETVAALIGPTLQRYLTDPLTTVNMG